MAWVLFDYGGVVSQWPSEEELESLAEVAGASVAKFSDAYWQRRAAFDRAELDAVRYWQQVGLILGRTADYDDATSTGWSAWTPTPGCTWNPARSS